MEDGTVKVAGNIDASAPNGGDGGFIETSAAHVKVDDSARVTTLAPYGKAGTWLIDPNMSVDFTIAASGGDMTGATLDTNLNSGNVTILSSSGTHGGTNGDVNVNDAVSWSASTTLTLSAYRNVNVNSNITATGNSAGLILTPDTGVVGGSYYLNNGAVITLSGTAPSLNIASHDYTVINDVTGLQSMSVSGYYALGSNIDASATSGWNTGSGFAPIGTSSTASFTAYSTASATPSPGFPSTAPQQIISACSVIPAEQPLKCWADKRRYYRAKLRRQPCRVCLLQHDHQFLQHGITGQ